MTKENSLMEQIIKELTEVKTEIKYLNMTLLKFEKVLENQAVLMEKQSVSNNRILDLENSDKAFEIRISAIEKWQTKVITLWTFISAWIAFIINKIF